jgi:hypothetical protein
MAACIMAAARFFLPSPDSLPQSSEMVFVSSKQKKPASLHSHLHWYYVIEKVAGSTTRDGSSSARKQEQEFRILLFFIFLLMLLRTCKPSIV